MEEMEANGINYKHAKRTHEKQNRNDKTKTSHNYTVCYISGVSIFVFFSRNLAALFESHGKKASWENLFKFNGCLFYSFLLFLCALLLIHRTGMASYCSRAHSICMCAPQDWPTDCGFPYNIYVLCSINMYLRMNAMYVMYVYVSFRFCYDCCVVFCPWFCSIWLQFFFAYTFFS